MRSLFSSRLRPHKSWVQHPPIDPESVVLSRERARQLGAYILSVASADTVSIDLLNTTSLITRIASGQVLSADDGDELQLTIETSFGGKASIQIETNQIDATTLRAMVQHAEMLAREQIGPGRDVQRIATGAQQYLPVNLWHDTTVLAVDRIRDTVIPQIITSVTSAGLTATGFVGVVARAGCVMTRDGVEAYYRETDSECTVSARGADGLCSGWSAQANRDWSRIQSNTIAATAVDIAHRSAGARALEPGRRTVIMGPLAVVQLLRHLTPAFDAGDTALGATPFSKPGGANRLGERIFDPRLRITSDPTDSEGGYQPYFAGGFPLPRMTWVADGVLKNLAYGIQYGLQMGKPYCEVPWSFRMSGGSATLDSMIASCEEGIYVNRFSNVNLVDLSTGMLTGVTRDGCFVVKQGKIDRPVKNFRFLDSPFFFLNNIEALGAPTRAAFGYTPPATYERNTSRTATWPRRPIICPAMMVRDFNFSALSDAV